MQRQTFGNSEVAAFLNRHFVCITVDRDFAPGLAAYGQQWLAAGQKPGGWPLNLWFTPELQPIEAASYLPPTEEWGREGFMVVAQRVADRWTANPDAVRRSAVNTQRLIADHLPFAAAPIADLALALGNAAADWRGRLNEKLGTFGDAPHRPEPELLRFLLAREGDDRRAAVAALRTRLASALRDPLDGGFHRATADAGATIPVFQKRLADQARIALACLDAARVDDDPVFAAGARSALDYSLTRLAAGNGLYHIGEDATLPEATQRLTWTWAELARVVDADEARALGARESGNIVPAEDLEGHHAGRNVLNAAPGAVAPQSLARLLAERENRGSTRLNDLATAAEHGLLLHALLRAADQLGEERYADTAATLRQALQTHFGLGSPRLSRAAGITVAATPEDYLLLALATGDQDLVSEADRLFYDHETGLYRATAEAVLGARAYWWQTNAAEIPAPAVWRALLGDAPAALLTELTAPFENPDSPPPGDVLLALSHASP